MTRRGSKSVAGLAAIVVATWLTVVTGAGPGAGGVAGAAGAGTTTSSVPSDAQISATENRVTTLERQISAQELALSADDEEYNQAVAHLQHTQQAITATDASLAGARAHLATDRARLSRDALRAYVLDTGAASIAGIFSTPSDTTAARTTYSGIAVGNVDSDIAAVQSGQRRLADARSTLVAEQRSEAGALSRENRTRQAASAAADQAQSTLNMVKGNLAQQIAARAAAQAAAAAAAAQAAQSQAAAQAQASLAAQAAQVAASLGNSSTATAAANSANQAAESGGVAPIVPSGTASAGGLAAVHGAMEYLGVPYVWGGASMSGVDCSGLTMLAWAHAGVSLTHSAALQYTESTHVSLNALQPGDLLFYDLDGTGIDHVVMYVGPTLDGQGTEYGSSTIIQAAHTGTVVSFNPLWYYGLVGAGRP